MVLECLSTAVRKIWTLTCLSSVVFMPLPQFIHPKNAPFVLPTSPCQTRCPKLVVGLAPLAQGVKQSRIYLLDTGTGKTYNISDAEVAQVVEQRTENPRVSGSTPLLGTTYEVVERNQVNSRTLLAKGVRLGVSVPKWRKGRRDSLKNCWGATPVSVRIRPSAPEIETQRGVMPGCVAIVQSTLHPLGPG